MKCCENSHEPYSKHFIFFVANDWAQRARVLSNTRVESFAREKHVSLLIPFVIYIEYEK
jgi:hypothetical protein